MLFVWEQPKSRSADGYPDIHVARQDVVVYTVEGSLCFTTQMQVVDVIAPAAIRIRDDRHALSGWFHQHSHHARPGGRD